MPPLFFRPFMPPQMTPYAYNPFPMQSPPQIPSGLGGMPAGGLPAGGLPPGGLPAGGLPPGGLPVGGLPAGGLPGGLPTGTGGLTGFLANANTLMENAQRFTPYVQQLQPMMKNLPALWRMYKSFKQSPDQASSNIQAPPRQTSREQRQTSMEQRPPQNQPQPQMQSQPQESAVPTTRPSVPKIYQPTWP